VKLLLSADSHLWNPTAHRYFGRVDDEHLVPGANLFFLDPNWHLDADPSSRVLAVPGLSYPQRLDPGMKDTPPGFAALPWGTDIPWPAVDGGLHWWNYTVVPNRPITRSPGFAPVYGPRVTAIAITTCSRSARWSLECPNARVSASAGLLSSSSSTGSASSASSSAVSTSQ
jgi:hypothetical protein